MFLAPMMRRHCREVYEEWDRGTCQVASKRDGMAAAQRKGKVCQQRP
jgi:hypothetical protein